MGRNLCNFLHATLIFNECVLKKVLLKTTQVQCAISQPPMHAEEKNRFKNYTDFYFKRNVDISVCWQVPL